MEQYKYITFQSVPELRDKLNQLQEVVERNLRETKEFLILNNIPFTELPDNTFIVDIANIDSDKMEEYYKEFESKSLTTRKKFAELGVRYTDDVLTRQN